MISNNFDDRLRESLNRFGDAALYLDSALEDGVPAFLLALADCLDARDGASLAAGENRLEQDKTRESLTLNGDPSLRAVETILSAFGLRLSVVPIPADRRYGTISGYRMNYRWNEAQGLYFGRIPALPGCEAYSETIEDLKTAMAETIEEWIAVARRYHRPIPPPQDAPIESDALLETSITR